MYVETLAPAPLVALPVFVPDVPVMASFFEALGAVKQDADYWRKAYERDDCPRLLLTDVQEDVIRQAGGTLGRAFAFLEAQEECQYPRNVSMSQFLTYFRDLSYLN